MEEECFVLDEGDVDLLAEILRYRRMAVMQEKKGDGNRGANPMAY